MERPRPDFDPYVDDPDRWGTSLAQMAELILPCLDAVGARTVVEIGAFSGSLTRVLADWAAAAGARVSAIDPAPGEPLVRIAEQRPELELVRRTSLDALAEMPLPDVAIVDGDHNWFTVSSELALIAARAGDGALPLLLFHDVCWPHGRRDDYFDASLIPPADRQATIGDAGGILPGEPGVSPGGLPYPRSAAREGGERNGVLTAVEDFVAAREELRLVVVPAFFGFGAVWARDAPYAADLAELLDPWDRNPILARLEANRVLHLARGHQRLTEIWRLQERQARQEAVLRRMLASSAFAVAERLSRLRVRAGIAPGSSVVSKDEIRRALD